MPDKTRIDFGEGTQSFGCDAPLQTKFRKFLESRGILTRGPELWGSAGTPQGVDVVLIEIADQSKGISKAEGEALIGDFLKSQNKGEV